MPGAAKFHPADLGGGPPAWLVALELEDGEERVLGVYAPRAGSR